MTPTLRHAGRDAARQVLVELDDLEPDVRLTLCPSWRSVLGPHALGAAVVEAWTAAATARLTVDVPPPSPPDPAPVPARRLDVATLRRAFRELREFRHQLTALAAATYVVGGPGRPVTVTVTAGQVSRVEIDPAAAPDAELERHVEEALRAALSLVAAFPRHALAGCPDLQAVLATTGGRR